MRVLLLLAPTIVAAALHSVRSGAVEEGGARCPGERWGSWPSPVGLTLGILCAFVGQVLAMLYQYARFRWATNATRIQPTPRPYAFSEAVATHVRQPGGVLMLVFYLSAYWMFDLMPCSYYSFEGGVRPHIVAAQIAIQDLLQYIMHWLEHKASPEFYKLSHKPHHRFTNPRWADAFNGSVGDTFTMILIPLFITAQLIHANVWEYMTFGASWSAWLVLIHSETAHPWDPLFKVLGLGTAADHHVHHKTFVYNYGHVIMWWDKIFGTYKDPSSVKQFNPGL
mmetsp:Transcript_18102/g.54605  ORF Transcript_18102/g.54605 Transcript_18102/m.54605 type:complete len:281 (+) Transcript_18102:115-957(+)|eukprot:scaffold227460_cov40-Tisochrysis_lutea.AAC.1